ncbi:consortin, connexin sorting protein b isoform X2 [Gambusia affinis]|uniref:consortin, connexin sorting protein b isoform X2 n=1 Tax=Gambusia affinis TaxID=33528 RepID=UPI001CDB8737|nr:consortin, connexin sorting protein b isoform X2 [Gambusia affinis]
MGNKNAVPPRGPGGGVTGKDDTALVSSATGGVTADKAQSPSPELLSSLQALGENDDYTLLPQSLHQIAETYSLRQDHQWAVQFLRLEKLYHERLLSNLTTLQEKWEREFNEKEDGETRGPPEEDSVSRKHIEKLSHICRTHHRPSFSLDQKNLNAALIDTRIGTETLQPHHGKANKPENTQSMMSQSDFSSPQREEEEERQDEEEALKKGQEVEAEEQEVEPEEQEVEPEEHAAHGEDTPEEEEVKVEWPAGVAQASDKDLAKLSIAEGSVSASLSSPSCSLVNWKPQTVLTFVSPHTHECFPWFPCELILSASARVGRCEPTHGVQATGSGFPLRRSQSLMGSRSRLLCNSYQA